MEVVLGNAAMAANEHMRIRLVVPVGTGGAEEGRNCGIADSIVGAADGVGSSIAEDEGEGYDDSHCIALEPYDQPVNHKGVRLAFCKQGWQVEPEALPADEDSSCRLDSAISPLATQCDSAAKTCLSGCLSSGAGRSRP